MIKGVGIDLVKISRFDIENERFVKRVLSDKEIVVFESLDKLSKPAYLASRFALKEAYYKASQDNCSFSSISFLNDEKGKPYMDCRNDVFVSISDEENFLIAYVIIDN